MGLTLVLLVGFGVGLGAGLRAAEDGGSEGDAVRPRVFRVSPHARFSGPDVAVVAWETEEASAGVVEYGVGGVWTDRASEAGPRAIHRLSLPGLQPRVLYQYRIRMTGPGGHSWVSDAYDLDNALNYTVARLPEVPTPYGSGEVSQRYAKAAEQILAVTGITRGYCLVLDCNEGQLAYELARRSELVVFGVDDDAGQVARGRALLGQAGAYGSRITLRRGEASAGGPFPRSFANLIVADGAVLSGRLPFAAASVLPYLQPATGQVCLGPLGAPGAPSVEDQVKVWCEGRKERWELTGKEGVRWLCIRGELPPNTGSWTHQYGDAGNSANSQEGLEGAAGTDQLDVQWFGRPGADFGIDRNPRMPAPLAVNGRLFHQGLNRLAALDSYNGALLWSLEVPSLRRVNMPRDAGNWCADGDHVYVAVEDRCWMLAAGSGDMVRTFALAEARRRTSHEWGWVARAGDLLYGSSVKQGASYTNFWGGESWYDATSGSGTEKVCSDDLFAVDRESGDVAWRYEGGVVINSTLGIADGRVLFVEARSPEVKSLTTGRIGSVKLWEEQFLVALDARTGTKLWEQPIDTADGIVVFYLVAADGNAFLMASAKGQYHLYAFRAADGAALWQAAHPWPKDNHGGHLQHPVVVRDAVFLEPRGYEAATGKVLTTGMGRHGGCATYAATLNALIYRGDSGSISMWDIDAGKVTKWHNLRPSCWLSTVPANGMVLSPEGGGGCSCGNWLETSLGFAPALNPAAP